MSKGSDLIATAKFDLVRFCSRMPDPYRLKCSRDLSHQHET